MKRSARLFLPVILQGRDTNRKQGKLTYMLENSAIILFSPAKKNNPEANRVSGIRRRKIPQSEIKFYFCPRLWFGTGTRTD